MTDRARDIVVIGASLGGIDALAVLAAQLPADLPATVLVVQHTGEESPGMIPAILERAGALPARMASDTTPLSPGTILVAPPGLHMLLTKDGARVTFGPRENRSRPAIDPLFRTAAVNYRSRVIGVVLTGMLGDGSAGLQAIARCGGVAVVQSPDDAFAPQMPTRALQLVPDARQVPLAQLGALLERLVREPAPAPPPVPPELQAEADVTERTMMTDDPVELPGRPTDFTCPACSGTIHEIGDGDAARRYRCRVGHAYGPESMIAAKDDALEAALWIALQTLQEQAQVLESIARDERNRLRARNADGFDARARETRAHAAQLRRMIESVSLGSR